MTARFMEFTNTLKLLKSISGLSCESHRWDIAQFNCRGVKYTQLD